MHHCPSVFACSSGTPDAAMALRHQLQARPRRFPTAGFLVSYGVQKCRGQCPSMGEGRKASSSAAAKGR